MKNVLVLATLILLTACVDDEPAIVKTESDPNDSKSEPELVEQVNKNKDEVDEFIEFPLNDEQIRINLKMVPILEAYLQAANDREKAIEGMKIERVHMDNPNIYLLEFSCKNESCSYLLFSRDVDDQTYLLADLAKSVEMIASPDNTKMLFLFQRNNTSLLPLSNIVVIDIETWEPLTLINETTEYTILDYTWPLISVEWIDNEFISIEKPAIIEPTNDLIYEWQNSNESLITNIVLSVQ